MSQTLDYGNIMNRAMRVFVRDVLQQVADNGLPGEHHFFITVDTQHPDVEIAEWLMMRYPDEITIVMQNWFENLEVQDDGFYVTLNFGFIFPMPPSLPLSILRSSLVCDLKKSTGQKTRSHPLPLSSRSPRPQPRNAMGTPKW